MPGEFICLHLLCFFFAHSALFRYLISTAAILINLVAESQDFFVAYLSSYQEKAINALYELAQKVPVKRATFTLEANLDAISLHCYGTLDTMALLIVLNEIQENRVVKLQACGP